MTSSIIFDHRDDPRCVEIVSPHSFTGSFVTAAATHRA
jgi:hypothetical protein